MLKKIFTISTILFLLVIPPTVKAEGFIPAICLMEEFDYCKDIDKIEVFDIKNNYMKKLKLYKKEWDGINEYIIIDNSYQKSKLYRIHKYSIR